MSYFIHIPGDALDSDMADFSIILYRRNSIFGLNESLDYSPSNICKAPSKFYK